MKKIFTTLFMVMGIYSLSQAQFKTKGDTEFGVGAGYGGAYLSNGGSGQTSKSIGAVNAAVSADHYFSDRWSLKVKVAYDQKGWGNGFLATPTQVYTGVEYKLTYITVPVMANWHFGKTRNWYLNFGPYVGFLSKAEAKAYNLDVTSAVNSTDGGLALGIGIKIPISERLKFFVEYEGQGGVVNAFKSTTDPAQVSRGSFNIGFNF
jgi:hypothetical protein